QSEHQVNSGRPRTIPCARDVVHFADPSFLAHALASAVIAATRSVYLPSRTSRVIRSAAAFHSAAIPPWVAWPSASFQAPPSWRASRLSSWLTTCPSAVLVELLTRSSTLPSGLLFWPTTSAVVRRPIAAFRSSGGSANILAPLAKRSSRAFWNSSCAC